MYNLRHFARVYLTSCAAFASAAITRRESLASMQPFGKMLTRGNSHLV
jgi:hypothetical protein